MDKQGIFEFGAFVLDVGARRLQRGDETVTLTPKVFETLRVLVENAGRLLTKEEMMKAIWPDRFVEEANLTQNISVLRRALGEAESGTKYIATYPGKGYQFIAPVRGSDCGAPETPVQAAARAGRPLRIRLWAALVAVLVVAAIVVLTQTGRRAAPELRRVPLTRLPGGEYQPAISRDGTKLAFVWDQEGPRGTSLLVKGPEDDSPRPLSRGPFDHSSPTWSPDGRFLAYLRYEPEATKVIVRPERGGPEKEIASLFPSRYGLVCRHLDWSPDGKTLAVDDKTSPAEPFGISLVDLDTGAKKRLSRPDSDIIGDVDPRFSPDGKLVSFVRMMYRFNHELFVAPVGGGPARQLTHDGKQIGGHDWSPDGSSILFSSDRTGEFAVWRLDVARGKLLPAGISGFSPFQLSVARTGGRLVYSEFAQDLNIWRLEIPAVGSRTQPAWTRVIASTGEDMLPQLSPDGKRICFRSNRADGEQLWISGADGSGQAQLTRGALRPAVGRWSPDGNSIVFNSAVVQTMYVVDAAGGVPRLLGGINGGHPAFSSDGRAVYYSDAGAIMSLRLPAGPATLVTASGGFPKIPSADGRHLYFIPGRTETAIWRLALNSRKTEKLLDGLLPGYWGCWAVSPAGIYYLSKDPLAPERAAVLFHAFASGKSVRVAEFPGPLPPIGTSTWSISSDERYLYCVRADQSNSDIVLVEDAT